MFVTEPFGPFTLLSRLAAGGMGEVWLATPHDVVAADELCLVKRVKAALVDDDDIVRRFLDESRLALLLSHERICRTVDAGRADGQDYLAVDVVEGVDLRQLMDKGKLDPAVALLIVADAFDGLAYAHGAVHPLTGAPLGVVHRDVSPANLMVAADGSAKFIDFGLALSSVRAAQTEQGIVLGKMMYMAPEQAVGSAVGPAADVFAMGIVLSELLTGQRYWGTRSAQDVWGLIARPFLPPQHQALDASLRGLVDGLLAFQPHQRPRRRELKEHELGGNGDGPPLLKGVDVFGAGDVGADEVVAGTQQRRRRCRRRQGLADHDGELIVEGGDAGPQHEGRALGFKVQKDGVFGADVGAGLAHGAGLVDATRDHGALGVGVYDHLRAGGAMGQAQPGLGVLNDEVGEVVFDQSFEAAAVAEGDGDVGEDDGGVAGEGWRLAPAVDELVEELEGPQMQVFGGLTAQLLGLGAAQGRVVEALDALGDGGGGDADGADHDDDGDGDAVDEAQRSHRSRPF